MRILIVDDSIDKITDLTELIYNISSNAIIETAENITNASTLLMNNNYNLAVIDLLLPMRSGQEPVEEGGAILVKEIYRNNNYKIPNYIIGFTQYDYIVNFSPIWKTITYGLDTNWEIQFKQLLNHINKTNFQHSIIDKTIPRVYVEGLTDKFYIEESIKLFRNDIFNKIEVVSQKSAGANWVSNQIIIWALKLQKDDKDNYLKAIGLLDSDNSGNHAKSKIESRALSDNEKKCVKILQLEPKYNKDIIDFYKIGIKIEIEIESLFPLEIIQHAESEGWLEFRQNLYLSPPKDWDQINETFFQFLDRLDISEQKRLYLKEVKEDSKEKFRKYINSLANKIEVYNNFKILLNDIININKIHI